MVRFVCLLIVPPLLLGQLDRSSLTGNVTDSQGNRVPQAEVRAIQSSTGLERRALTSQQGAYVIDSLPLGRYTVVFSKPGFSDVRVEQVEQSIGQTRTLDAQLGIAQNIQSTTVEDALAQLDRTSAVVGQSIEQTQLQELPLNGRNWSHLTALAPGAIDNGPSDQRTIRFAGHGLDDNNFTFDGVDASGILNQAQKEYVRLAIPLDSIAEFRVEAQNFNADVGMTAGGQISVASPSGTNVLHGSAFNYLRNAVLDSRSPFDGSSPAPFVMNQFGGSLGGAIVPNRTFYYANYEGLRQRLGQTQIGLVPSPSFIAQVDAKSPALAAVAGAYPAGTSPTSNPNVWNYVAGANQLDNEDSGMVRIDQHFSRSTTGFVRFSRDEADYTIPTGSLNARQETDTKLLNGVAELLHVVSPALLNEARFGINQDQYHIVTASGSPDAVKVTGFTALNAPTTSDGLGTTFSWLNDTTWSKGAHVIKFGVEIRTIHMNQGASPNGTLTYQSAANFLNNALDSATYVALTPLKRLRKTQSYGYIQDEFRVAKSLTITMGLRYDFFNVFHETTGRAKPFDLETCGGYCSPNASFSNPRKNDFDPRVGLAWSHGNTVVRAGAGIYHSDGQEDDQNLPDANDLQRYSLTSLGITGLSYPITPFIATSTGIVTPRDDYRKRKDFYVSAWTASVQQSLPGKLIGTATYLGNKGTDVLTTTYQNVINPLTGVRPYPQFGTIEFRKNDSNSTFEAAQLNLRRQFYRRWTLSANYMWSHALNDDGIGGGESDVPQNVSCRACEKASSDFDVRHVFNANAVFRLPWGVEFSGVATSRSGLPVNVTVDRANSALPDGNSISGSERPNLVLGVPLYTPQGSLNLAAFAVPANGTWGNAGRNIARGPALWQIDASLAKTFRLTEKLSAQLRVEGYNLANRSQFGQPLADISNPLNFGAITSLVNTGATGSGTPRQFQFGLKLSF
jgi:hypothetical protein